jgi:hypothetical protein
MKFPILSSSLTLAAAANAAIITFESPTYSTATTLSVAPANVATNRAFDGQDGWSRSTSSSTGTVVSTTTSGEYIGGQAIGGATYIGANRNEILTSNFSFDLRYGSGQEMGVGHWNDDDNDGLFDQGESELQIGVVSGAGGWYFGARYANFGTRVYSDGAGNVVSGGPGVAGTAGHWYRFNVEYIDNGGNYDITVDLRNLTTSTDIDFDSGTAGVQNWNFTITAAQFGVAPADADGLFVRTTTSGTNGLLDNINTAVPEPSAALLAGLGLLGLLRRRRA